MAAVIKDAVRDGLQDTLDVERRFWANQRYETKVRFGDLHWPIKIAVVMSWTILVLWVLGFLYGFLTGGLA